MTSSAGFGGFHLDDTPTAEIDRLESYLVPLADSVRDLLDAALRTTVDEAGVNRARAEIDAVTARLRASQIEGTHGVHFNHEGRSWQWGNAAVGTRNAVAPPMTVRHGDDGTCFAEVDLGAAYEGPPGKVHGGVSALLLDHLMGVTASADRRPNVTGTLTIRYRRLTSLGRVRLEGRIDRFEGIKTFVTATVSDADGLTIEAEGIFVMPKWARDHFPHPS
jgi:acyl-coenzyme A thioesterase PaaI-like protein